MYHIIRKSIGFLFMAAGRVAPDRTAAGLAKLFLVPIPRMGPASWDRLPATVENPTTYELSAAGRTIPVWKFGHSDRRVLFCHGWGGNGSNCYAMIPGLLDAGFEVHTFDAPSHGDDRRRPTNLLEFGDVFDALIKKNGSFYGAIGHSFGAGAIIYALSRNLEVSRVALVAPLIDSYAATDYFLDQLDIKGTLRSNVHERLQHTFRDYIDGWDLATLSATYTTPARIFHDVDDPRVPHSAAAKAAEGWQNCSLVTVEGLGHHKILTDPDMARQVIDFVSEVNSPT